MLCSVRLVSSSIAYDAVDDDAVDDYNVSCQ
jgi:hypothetical protein